MNFINMRVFDNVYKNLGNNKTVIHNHYHGNVDQVLNIEQMKE